jgi:DNA-directed RNA polymerase specialized sigma24 family protein
MIRSQARTDNVRGTDANAPFTLSRLDRALGERPEEQRAIILPVGLESLSYQQIAAVLRIPVGTMRSHLSRARAGLHQAMGVATPARTTHTRVARAG